VNTAVPSAILVAAYLRRGIWLWISLRLLATAVYLFADADPIPFWSSGSIGMVAAVTVLAFVDMRVRKEGVLIGNLGVASAVIAALCAAPAAAGEVLITIVGRLS
jgi:hypothetical protein